MPYPTVQDDGHVVTLDLHGALVDEAIDIVYNAIREATRRGRDRVKIIHGSSTSANPSSQRTIKRALYDLIESGELSRFVQSEWRSDNFLLVSLDVTSSSNSARLRITDLL